MLMRSFMPRLLGPVLSAQHCKLRLQQLDRRRAKTIALMAQYRTSQEKIDAATLEIKNPNVVGSGYIQHPPQKPFAAPLQMQPPTVAHFEFPSEYSRYREHTRQNGSQGPPRRAVDQRSQGYAHANGRPQNGPAPYSGSSGQRSSYRQAHAAPGRGPQHLAGAGNMPARGAPRPGRGPNSAPAPQAQARPAAVPVGPRRVPIPAAPPQHQHATSAAQPAPCAASQRPSAPSAHPRAPAAPVSQSAPMADGQSAAPPARAVSQMTLAESGPYEAAAHLQSTAAEPEEHDKAVSKSQAKRLRKKKREGKV